MFDLSFYSTSEKAESGSFLHFKDYDGKPINTKDGEPVGVYLRSVNSARVKKRKKELHDEWLASVKGETDPTKSVERMVYEFEQMICAAVVNFQNCSLNGKKLTGDQESATLFVTDKGLDLFKEQAGKFFQVDANFMKGA